MSFAIPALPPKSIPALPYEKPNWSGTPCFEYKLEVLKNGSSLETIDGPKKEFVSIGRLPICDIPMEHPSVSRYHAIIQFDQDGDAYLFDMDSAHGTRLNKKQIPGREYVQLKPGDQIRFGESTRICIFESEKPYDPEAEAEERRKIALQQRLAKARGQEQQQSANADDTAEQGISWGFGDDAEEEEEEEENEEEGEEQDEQAIVANLNKSGDASLLDIEATKMAFEDAKRRREDIEIMYGDDSDEDLYDKTKKRSKKVEKAETHDELVVKQKEAEANIKKVEAMILEKKNASTEKKQEDEQDLDAYMSNLSKKPLNNDKSLFTLAKELKQLQKLSL
ncbi:SMAD/FHA domain-containing protein [Helicostylum pulchrum]|nr:SMAD/FHA domain-containing protein [Helicostylum pulchrum]